MREQPRPYAGTTGYRGLLGGLLRRSQRILGIPEAQIDLIELLFCRCQGPACLFNAGSDVDEPCANCPQSWHADHQQRRQLDQRTLDQAVRVCDQYIKSLRIRSGSRCVMPCNMRSAALVAVPLMAGLALGQKAPEVAVVSTPAQLQAAIRSKVQDIHITEHMDLTRLSGDSGSALFEPAAQLRSITVRHPLACCCAWYHT